MESHVKFQSGHRACLETFGAGLSQTRWPNVSAASSATSSIHFCITDSLSSRRSRLFVLRDYARSDFACSARTITTCMNNEVSFRQSRKLKPSPKLNKSVTTLMFPHDHMRPRKNACLQVASSGPLLSTSARIVPSGHSICPEGHIYGGVALQRKKHFVVEGFAMPRDVEF